VAGWFAAASLARQGPGAFAAARLRRLGLPLIVFVLVLQPLTDYIGNLRDERGSFLFYLGHTEVSVMWFVAALLAFALAYAALRARRPAAGMRRPASPSVAVLAAGLAVAAGSLLVWPVWPWNADVVLNLRVGEWPQAAALFAIGVHAGEHGWLDTMSRATQRRLGVAAAVGVAAFGALFGAELAWGDVNELLYATSAGPTMTLAVLDGLIAVSWSLWCVAWFRRRWPGHRPVLDRAARASYATYIIHPLVLTAMMVAFAVVPLPPVTKFLIVSAAAVPACFAVGYALTRIPGTAAVL